MHTMDDLRHRLSLTRRASIPWDDDAARGITATELDALLERWQHDFDADAHRRRIDALPWVELATAHGPMRVIHRPAADPHAHVVVLLHGWPDSVLRFERVLPLLDDVHVIVPALPGFPFAPPLTETGMTLNRMAAMVAEAVGALGYARCTVSGGDVGGMVAEILAAEHPDLVASLHLTNVGPQRAIPLDTPGLAEDAAAWITASPVWFRAHGAYVATQASRPSTLGVALGDSPAGLLAWIAEKLRAWSDAEAFTDDDVLAWVTPYWTDGAIATSFTTYTEQSVLPARVETPTVLSIFAHDIKPEPRSLAELVLDVREYIKHEHGGHFAAWEQPEVYAGDLRRAIALTR